MRDPIYGLGKKAGSISVSGGRYFCMLMVIVCVGFTGCKGDTSPEMVTDIQLAEKAFILGVGNQYQLNVFHFPEGISEPAYDWRSTDENVVAVTGGVITGKATGEALVIVEIRRLQLADTCRVTVKNIPVDRILLSPEAVTIKTGETVVLTPVVEPAPSDELYFIWESQDPEVATVENGVVTGLRGGSALITVKTVFSELPGTAVVSVERDLVTRSVEVSAPGTLEGLLDPEEKITDLTLTGQLNAVDLKTISTLEYLYSLNMEQVQIQEVYLQMGYFAANELLAENFRGMRIDQVILPPQLRTVPARCFAYSSLSGIDFPASVEYIGEGAFMGASLLGEVALPSHITTLPGYVFAESGIEKVEFPAALSTIGSELFRDCIRLTALDLPATVQEMGTGIFKGCIALQSVALPRVITQLPAETFSGCISLSAIDLPSGLQEIGESAFLGCSSLGAITLPSALTEIAESLFRGCSSLQQITLPVGIEQIGANAFYGCSSLREIHVGSSTPPEVPASAFSGVNLDNCVLYVPAASLETYQKHAVFKDFKQIVGE